MANQTILSADHLHAAAQSPTICQAAEKALFSRLPGDVIPAIVTRLAPFGAYADLGGGVSSLVSIDRISISRIAHPSHRFALGQRIFCVIQRLDPERGHIHLTHRELLGTWEENAALFTPGTVVSGVVRGIKPYGVFVELSPNFSGLAEYQEDLTPGDRVAVYVKSISPGRMKCKLLVLATLPAAPLGPLRYFLPPRGFLRHWKYAPEGCQKPGTESLFSRD